MCGSCVKSKYDRQRLRTALQKAALEIDCMTTSIAVCSPKPGGTERNVLLSLRKNDHLSLFEESLPQSHLTQWCREKLAALVFWLNTLLIWHLRIKYIGHASLLLQHYTNVVWLVYRCLQPESLQVFLIKNESDNFTIRFRLEHFACDGWTQARFIQSTMEHYFGSTQSYAGFSNTRRAYVNDQR